MRISDFDVLIAPDLNAGPDDWPRRWLAKLSTARLVAPQNPSAPWAEAWTSAIAEAAREATRPILFVGHGVGAAAIAGAAHSLGGADVRGAFLVAPPDELSLARIAGSGWALPRAPLPWPCIVVASRTHALSDYEAAAALAALWGAELIDAGAAGGLDAESGHGPWPEGLMRLAAFIKSLR